MFSTNSEIPQQKHEKCISFQPHMTHSTEPNERIKLENVCIQLNTSLVGATIPLTAYLSQLSCNWKVNNLHIWQNIKQSKTARFASDLHFLLLLQYTNDICVMQSRSLISTGVTESIKARNLFEKLYLPTLAWLLHNSLHTITQYYTFYYTNRSTSSSSGIWWMSLNSIAICCIYRSGVWQLHRLRVYFVSTFWSPPLKAYKSSK
jgi:hypothetical protein